MRIATLFLMAVSLTALAAPPVVTSIDPKVGFSYGATRATIHGSNFHDDALLLCPVPPPGGTGAGTCPARVFVGGIEATVTSITPTEIRVLVLPSLTSTPRENGRADVRVVIEGKGEATLPSAFEFRLDAFPGMQNYTPIIVPFTSEQTRGANGSIWTSEFTAFNSSHVPATMLGVAFADPRFLSPPQSQTATLPPRATRTIPLFNGQGTGAFLYVPNPLVNAIKMSERVRDVSQTATSWGTEVPVLRYDDMKTFVTLIDIPTDPRYRATLRIYHWAVGAGLPARVEVYASDAVEPVEMFETTSQRGGAAEDDFLAYPSYVQLDLLTPKIRASGPTIRVEIDNLTGIVSPPLPSIWAMVSITNNETQQVTIVTPK